MSNRNGNTTKQVPCKTGNISNINVMKEAHMAKQLELAVSNVINLMSRNNTMVLPSPIRLNDQHVASNTCTLRRVSFPTEEEQKNKTENDTGEKRVRFSLLPSKPTENVSSTNQKRPWAGALTEEHCKELWFQKDELGAIKQEAKLAIATRTVVHDDPKSSEEQRENLAGLERFTRERAIWKKSAIRYVLLAQKNCRLNNDNERNSQNCSNEEYIGRVSLRCTGWARETAQNQGFVDYCAVHDPLASLFSGDETSSEDETEQINYNDMIFGDMAGFNSVNGCKSNAKRNKRKAEHEQRQQDLGCNRRIRRRCKPIAHCLNF